MSDAFITALGPVNPSWQRTTIADLAVYVGSGVTPTGGSDVYTTSGVTFIRSQNVTNEGLLLDDVAFIDEHTHERMSGSAVAPFDVLLNITGASIGRCCFLPSGLGPTNVNQHVCAIRLPAADEGDAKFLSSVLSSPIGQNQIFRLNAGGNREGLNYQQLRRFQIPWPAQAQRSKIARILTTLDNVIAQTEALIAKYQAIKQGLMHDLFTRGVDATGKLRPPQSEAPELYKQSDLGWIPKEWDTCIGAELADLITKGESPTWQGFSYQDDGVVFVTSENVREGYIDVSSPKFVSDAFDSKLYRSRLAPGDVLINLVGASIGRSCRVPQDFRRANINQAVCLFRAKNGCWSEWISYYFQLPQVMTRLTSEQVETARANVSLTDIREFVFPVPDDAEIQRVIEVLSANDRLVGATESSLVALRKKKTGLMQDLLTGKVPVKADEPEEITS